MGKSKHRFASKLGARSAPCPKKRSPLLRKRTALLLTALAVGIVLLTFYLFPSAATNPDQRLNAFLAQAKAPLDVQEAYRFATAHPEILKTVPCYCGCVSHGHKHNYNCFLKDNGELDEHGLNCGMCVQTALKAKHLYQKGASLLEIRKQVDATYQKLPDMKPTPTPLPKQV